MEPFTLQTKATTRDASDDPTLARSGLLDSPGPPARCLWLSGERGPEGEPGSLPFVTWPEEKAASASESTSKILAGDNVD